MKYIPVAEKHTIPALGLGTWKSNKGEVATAVSEALKIGYRHIDCAPIYMNEQEVGTALGTALQSGAVQREELWITSKLWYNAHAKKHVRPALEKTLRELQLDYLDLFLIHWPLPAVGDFVDTWKALIEIYRSGRVRAIGVSNFQPHHLDRLAAETTVVPAANQIEIHPYFAQDDVRAFDREHGIATEAWSPIGQGQVLDDPTIVHIAERVHRTPAQVTLRWHIQRGDIVFPKSVTPARIAENFAIFDFELADEEMAAITALRGGGRRGPDPDEFNWIP